VTKQVMRIDQTHHACGESNHQPREVSMSTKKRCRLAGTKMSFNDHYALEFTYQQYQHIANHILLASLAAACPY
jgi:hypothetical protein